MLPQTRLKQSITPYHSESNHDATLIISPSDLGVRENSGRPGAKWGGKAITSQLGKLLIDKKMNLGVYRREYNQDMSLKEQQQADIQALKGPVKNSQQLIHIGGGHDHIYPLIRSLENSHEGELFIFNIDPHFDMRKRETPNSGTPFRDAFNESEKKFKLYQIGTHLFANDLSTREMLSKNNPEYITMESLRNRDHLKLDELFPMLLSDLQKSDNPLLVFSIDVDALDGAIMPAVSAVNGEGFNKAQLTSLLDSYLGLAEIHSTKKILGIYEYNPLYDDNSTSGARYLAQLIHRFLQS